MARGAGPRAGFRCPAAVQADDDAIRLQAPGRRGAGRVVRAAIVGRVCPIRSVGSPPSRGCAGRPRRSLASAAGRWGRTVNMAAPFALGWQDVTRCARCMLLMRCEWGLARAPREPGRCIAAPIVAPITPWRPPYLHPLGRNAERDPKQGEPGAAVACALVHPGPLAPRRPLYQNRRADGIAAALVPPGARGRPGAHQDGGRVAQLAAHAPLPPRHQEPSGALCEYQVLPSLVCAFICTL